MTLNTEPVPFAGWVQYSDDTVMPIKENKMSVLDIAKEIIYGDREKTYGKPSKNLDTIAQMWTAYVESASNGKVEMHFTAKDVAIMMVLLKAARLANDTSHKDSIIDICGYAALIERCDE